jgi:methylmalonyl-CoA mutase
VSNDGFASRDEMIAAFNVSNAKLACLCSSDKVYAREAVEAARALVAAGAAHLYLAGRPGELERALRENGVQDFIHVGCDALGVLHAAHRQLDVQGLNT